MIGLPFMSVSPFTSPRGWVMRTCGSFWKIAATAFTGALALTMLSAMKSFEPMPKSAAPPARSCGTFTLGPPCTMRTFEPALGIEPLRERLVEAAMLGLRLPVGDEGDRGRGPRGQGCEREAECERQTFHVRSSREIRNA